MDSIIMATDKSEAVHDRLVLKCTLNTILTETTVGKIVIT